MPDEAERFVALTEQKIDDGELTRKDLYRVYMARSTYIRWQKIAKYDILKEYSRRGLLTKEFLNAFSNRKPELEADEAYVTAVGRHLLKQPGKGELRRAYGSLAQATARVTWGEGGNPQAFTMPLHFTIWLFSDPHFPYNKTRYREQAVELIGTCVSDFVGDNRVRSWVNAGGNNRFYGVFYQEELVGFLYQTWTGDLPYTPLIMAFGVKEAHRSTGIGSALVYRVLTDLADEPHIIADIDREHPQSLRTFRRAAPVYDRDMVAIGRLNGDFDAPKLEQNRRPRIGECTEWCLKRKDAPDLYPGRLPRGTWPREENEEDMSSTMVTEDEYEEEEEVPAATRRGRKPKPAQYRKGAENPKSKR